MCQNEGNECQLVDISKIKTKTLLDQPLMSKLAYIKNIIWEWFLFCFWKTKSVWRHFREFCTCILKTCCMCLVHCKCTYLSLWNWLTWIMITIFLLKSIWYVYVVFTNPGNYILYTCNNKTILAQDSLNTIYWGNSRDI